MSGNKYKSEEVVTVRFTPERKAQLKAQARRWRLVGKMGAPNVSEAVRRLVDKGLACAAREREG